MPAWSAVFRLPVMRLAVRSDAHAILSLEYVGPEVALRAPSDAPGRRLAEQIEAYLADPSFVFDLPLKWTTSVFQRRVCGELRQIPSGSTETYGSLAKHLNSAPRAVGGACRRNPFPLVVPCHRVVAATGIGGFSGNTSGPTLELKRALLQHEGVESA